MKIVDNINYLSATDLSTYIACKHATYLNLLEAKGEIKVPYFDDPLLKALQEKGEEFEQNYIQQLKAEGKSLIEINKVDRRKAVNDTIQAMKDGYDIICQARLEHGIWNGWADFLIKVPIESNFGNWSYEVLDTKLSKHTKAGAILQISLYSEMLEVIQGVKPEYMHIKNPEGETAFRVDDYIAYFRLMKKRLLECIENGEEPHYPNPVLFCDVCKWWSTCNGRRRADDHLSFVAGMGSLQITEVNKNNITTLESMALLSNPIPFKPDRGSIETFQRLAHQARLQHQARTTKKPVYELLPLQNEFGFYRLPEPSENDIFFDFEGDPFVGSTGLEYLFGWIYKDDYNELWAANDGEEKKAFEDFIDFATSVWKKDPGMHIYHFGAYEETAFKRLAGKYATREDELDCLLRAKVFINLHTVLKQSVIAGVERYSLKDLEKFHNYYRDADLRIVGPHKALYENLLECGNVQTVSKETIAIVRDYNKDDCLSTKSLRNWLEGLRAEMIAEGNDIPRPIVREGDPTENITKHQQRIKPLFDALMKDIPFNKEERSREQQAKWLLAHMLDWYRREKKSFWWEYFRLKELSEDELLDERMAVSKLEYTGKREHVARSVIDYYQFPEQEYDIEVSDKVKYKGDPIGTIDSIDNVTRTIGLKRMKNKDIHPTYVIHCDDINDSVKEEAIIRFAEWINKNGFYSKEKDFKCGRDLLLRNTPTVTEPVTDFEDAKKKATDWISKLDHSVLPIQGPPGTGKSFAASRMILSLIKEGKKIGVTALGHKVITELLMKITEAAIEENLSIKIIQKVRELTETGTDSWIQTTENEDVSNGIEEGFHIAAGTAFMWAKSDFYQKVDVLFVDEAGQLSLIDTLALSHATKNLVLLGDPQQLKQPQKGTHPEGTEVSALEHVLQDQKTISIDQGVFLNETWRMHPIICNYVSELFYDGKLAPMPKNINQRIVGNTKFNKPGIYIEQVEHFGNCNSSMQEVDRVQEIVNDLLKPGVYWEDCDKKKHPINNQHIKIIAPYNSQVNALARTCSNIQVGTVDKFQGQEAPVIIFSMTTSSPEDAPRGMEFLYSLNRINVAVSRARAVFILVASPALFEPSCKSPHQMKLANALCRLLEVAN